MADENLTNDFESLEGAPDDKTLDEQETVEVVGDAESVFEETTPVDDLSDEVEALNDKVEAAVAHVAEEAELDAKKVENIKKDLGEDTTAEADEEPAPKKRERRSKQARAEKAAKADAAAATSAAKPAKVGGLASLGVGAWIAIAVGALALGLVLGRFVLGGGAAGSAALAGKTTVSESELDKAYATYTYNGATNTITVRQVIEQNGTVESAKTEDGTYTVPSADYALNVARTEILNKEVESRGITVSDEDVEAYAEKALGTKDFDAIASTYGMDAEEVKSLIEENCKVTALREEIVGEDLGEMPEAPTAPAEGAEDQVTKEYADYIIKLAGDAWNAKKGEWAEKDSAYATALDGATFSADGANYSAAQSAYYVAYQEYSTKQTEITEKWTEYLNGLLSNATINVGTLVS